MQKLNFATVIKEGAVFLLRCVRFALIKATHCRCGSIGMPNCFGCSELDASKTIRDAPQRVDPSAGLRYNDDENIADDFVTVGCFTHGVDVRYRAVNIPVQEDVVVTVRKRHYSMLFIDHPIFVYSFASDAGYLMDHHVCPLVQIPWHASLSAF